MLDNIDFSKYVDGLVPAVIQDIETSKVLMLGFMNAAAIETTLSTKTVTFYSRSKNRLWTKGEESGHFLNYKEMLLDCDADSLLVKVVPVGPTCHNGTDTCWGEENNAAHFLTYLETVIARRKNDSPETSYVASLFAKGINKMAQKVGEEAVELVIEAKDDNELLFLNEASDLLFHYLILLQAKGYNLQDVIEILKNRHKK
jgi:phosphoribosyl-ATP pyrophosphohydrolase/phosphoribosyl-AMP cyclohydrolase